MKEFRNINQNKKPDKKIADMVGQTVEIVALETHILNVRGKDMTFNTVTLSDNSTISVNATVAKQIKEHEGELPFSVKIGQKRAKLGNYCYLE
jgi:hypothetical protein